MKPLLKLLLCSALLSLPFLTTSASAAEESATKDLVLRGDARCTTCHDESDSPQLLAIGKTKHGVSADTRTPTCTSCHGSSDNHVGNPTGAKPDRMFGKNSATPATARSAACLNCHQQDADRHLWLGSTHESRGLACSSCHQIHAATDPVRDRRSQPAVCFTCHKEQRAQVNKPSHHPVLEGKVICSDCHNPHGSAGPKLMKRDSVNDTCYTCHMEKRGPFVHSHEPVSEDCSICHNPHGTTAESMLKTRPPFLCQSCHTPHMPIAAALTGNGTTNPSPGWWNSAAVTQGRGCLNCHTEIHGSNNPSAVNPAPQNLFR
jgi:DmsE family decaheme c-type cytochrome